MDWFKIIIEVGCTRATSIGLILPLSLLDARIMSFGYNADVFVRGRDILSYAKNLLKSVAIHRQDQTVCLGWHQ
jgi:hypothetical protein